jgi:hypothetical protein
MAQVYQNPQSLPNVPGFTDQFLSGFDATYFDTTLVQAYANNIINKYGDQGYSDFMMISALGGRKGIANDTYYGWERGFFDSAVTADDDVTAGGAGQSVTFPLVVGDVTSSGHTYLREQDVIVNSTTSDRLLVRDITITGGVATVIAFPLDGSATVEVTAGDIFFIIGNAFNEGTGQPESIQTLWYKYNTRTQILKDTYSLSGSQLTNQPQWTDGPLGSFIAEGGYIAEWRMAKKMALTMIYGQKNTNSSHLTERTTTGLDKEITARGLTVEYGAAVTDFGVDDLITLKDQQLRRWASDLMLAWLPTPMMNSLNASLRSSGYLGNSNINNATERLLAMGYVGGDMEAIQSLRTTFNWDEVNVQGMSFVLKNLRIMNDPNGAGADINGFTQSTGYVIPLNKTENKETGDLSSRIELVYKSNNGINRLFNVTQDGRASARQIGPNDVSTMYYSAEYGWMFRGLEQFTKFTKTGA